MWHDMDPSEQTQNVDKTLESKIIACLKIITKLFRWLKKKTVHKLSHLQALEVLEKSFEIFFSTTNFDAKIS